MKPHIDRVDGNVITSADDGSTWATWQVMSVPFRYTSNDARLNHHAAVATLLRSLRGPALLFSVCQPVTATTLARALREGGVPSDRLDDRVDLTVAAHVTNSPQTFYERTFWLAARLHGGRSESMAAQAAQFARDTWRAAMGRLFSREWFEDADDERARHLEDQVTDLESRLGLLVVDGQPDPGEKPPMPTAGRIMCRRARRADIEWWTARLPRRGTVNDVALADWDSPDRSGEEPRVGLLNYADWAENYTDAPSRLPRRHVVAATRHQPDPNPADDDDCGPVLSYQSNLVVATAPADVWYPGGVSEWFVRAANATGPGGAFPVDWFCYVNPLAGDKAKRRVDWKLTNADEQVTHQETATGAPQHTYTDVQALTALRDQVAAGEPLFETHTWFTITAPDLRTLERRVVTFNGLWQTDEWDLPLPSGDQEAYVRASQPGAALPDVTADFKREQPADLIAMGAPFAGADVGDPWGALIGVNLGDGLAGKVLFDPGYGIRVQNASGSILFIGTTGAGKSQTKKSVAEALMPRGSRFVAIDIEGEYVTLAHAIGGQVIDPYAATVSLDPLAIYRGLPDSIKDDPTEGPYARDRAISAAVGIVHELTGKVETHGAVWADLRHIIDLALTNHKRLADVVDAVGWVDGNDVATFPSLVEVAKVLRVVAGMASMRCLFDPYLVPFNATTPLTVLVLRDISLPSGEDGKASSPEERQGSMLLHAAVHAAREAVYRDSGRYGAVILDESRVLLQSQVGRDLIWELLDRGRKHHAGVWLSVTDPRLLPASFVEQARTRFIFRIEESDTARVALPLLGDAATDPAVIGVLRGLGNGQCMFRDVRGRVGRVEILRPLVPAVLAAVTTTPELNVSPNESEAA